ncbi:MAG: hypothetical protein V2I67_06475 [Thermoanaerobaculales bacterium]|jgi:hypothetical protein|nr:hypothetical protein [Thermoanaerobaculales bacterium]
MSSILRTTGLAVIVATATACSLSTTGFVGDIYYGYGPEAALETAATFGSPEGERSLLELERAVALLELGRYRECLQALERARLRIEADVLPGGDERRGPPPWRPALHEAVLIATMEMTAAFGMQDGNAAAAAADRAVAAMDATACAACSFNFTRVLAALAYAEVGRFDDGLAALSGVVVVGRGDDLVEELRRRLDAGPAGAEAEGLAPPPVEPRRSAVVALLLGMGPTKVGDELAVNSSSTVDWVEYLPRTPQTVSWAALELGEGRTSAVLTDVHDLAVVGLKATAERAVSDGGRSLDWDTGDLRHWASLPATMQMIVADIPQGEDGTDLVYYSRDGDEVYGETILWPVGWTGGRIFVVRRMP